MEHFPDDFEPTHPDQRTRQRLRRKTRWFPPVRHVPNRISRSGLMGYAFFSLAFGAWALIGALTGHMHAFGGAIAFAGLGALLITGAALASAAACTLRIVDHFDRRNNEALYETAQSRLVRSAIALCLLACAVACEPLLADDTGWGLLSAKELQALVSSEWVADRLRPWQPQMDGWLIGSTGWFFGLGLLIRLLGFKPHQPIRSPILGLIAAYIVVAPLLAAFGVSVVWHLATADTRVADDDSEGDTLAGLALALSWLLLLASAWLALLAAPLFAVAGWWRGRDNPKGQDPVRST